MGALIRETNSLLRIVIIGTFVLGVVFIAAGVAYVYMGGVGDTEFSFFGQTFKSTSVGIAAFFLGAAIIVLVVRRSLSTLDRTVTLETPRSGEDSNAGPDAWPNELSVASLSKTLRAMSEQQWQLLEIIEEYEGLGFGELADRSAIPPSLLCHRLNTLEDSKLIKSVRHQTYLAKEVKEVLGHKEGLTLKAIRKNAFVCD
jgi:predicted transcriptional regulator